MLTAGFARSRTVDGEARPLFIGMAKQRYRKIASELIQLFEAHLGEPKGKLEDAIDE